MINKKLTLLLAVGVPAVIFSACKDEQWWPDAHNKNSGSEMTFNVTTQNSVKSVTARSLTGNSPKINSSDCKYSYFEATKLAEKDYIITAVEDEIDGAFLGKSPILSSRSEEISDATSFKTAYSHIDISAYGYDPQEHADAITAIENNDFFEYFAHEIITLSGDTYSPSRKLYWASDDYNLSFFAVAPTTDDFTVDDGSGNQTKYTTTFNFEEFSKIAESDFTKTGPESEDVDSSSSARRRAEENADENANANANVVVSNVPGYEVIASENIPHINYIVPDNPEDQRDIMVATKTMKAGGGSGTQVALNFNHVLSAVKVVLASNYSSSGISISKVEFKNIRYCGMYEVGENHWDTSLDYIKDFTFGPDEFAASTTSNDVTTAHYLENECTLMMIPQTFKSTEKPAQLIITTSDNNTHTIDLLEPWVMGKTTTYTLSKTDEVTQYHILTEWEEMYFSWNGEPAGFKESASVSSESGSYTNNYDELRIKCYKEVTKKVDGVSTTIVSPANWVATLTSYTIKDDDDGNGTTEETTTTGVRRRADESNTTNASTSSSNSKVYYPTSQAAAGAADDKLESYGARKLPAASILESSNDDEIKKIKEWAYSLKFAFDEQTPTEKSDADTYAFKETNKKTTLGTKDNPIDVSTLGDDGKTVGSVQNTSNCYIINYPGYYQIPLVVGNGITNGAYNSSAWILGTIGTGASGNLLTASGDTQSAGYTSDNVPWIGYWTGNSYYGDSNYYPPNDGTEQKIKDVFIIWEDSETQVVDVTNYSYKISKDSKGFDRYMIRFKAGVDGLGWEPCNAVIVVLSREANNYSVLWSYHIWVTPYTRAADRFTADCNQDSETSLLTGAQRTFMKHPLGFVQEKYKIYKERTATILLQAADNNNNIVTGDGASSATVTLIQRSHECHPYSCVYYQWGRKDPFPGALIYETGHMHLDETYYVEYTPKKTYADWYPYNNNDEISYSENRFSNSGTDGVDAKAATAYIYSGILYPQTFYIGDQYPTSAKYDYWGCLENDADYGQKNDNQAVLSTTTNAASKNRKTIYDPCPPGFKVPPIHALPAVTYDGKNHVASYSPVTRKIEDEETVYKKVNTSYTNHLKFVNSGAFEMYCDKMTESSGIYTKNPNKNSGTFLIYATGQRYPKLYNGIAGGKFVGVGTQAYLWSSTKWVSNETGTKSHKMYYLQFSYDSSGKTNFEAVMPNTHTTYGFPVLPMLDISESNPK